METLLVIMKHYKEIYYNHCTADNTRNHQGQGRQLAAESRSFTEGKTSLSTPTKYLEYKAYIHEYLY